MDKLIALLFAVGVAVVVTRRPSTNSPVVTAGAVPAGIMPDQLVPSAITADNSNKSSTASSIVANVAKQVATVSKVAETAKKVNAAISAGKALTTVAKVGGTVAGATTTTLIGTAPAATVLTGAAAPAAVVSVTTPPVLAPAALAGGGGGAAGAGLAGTIGAIAVAALPFAIVTKSILENTGKNYGGSAAGYNNSGNVVDPGKATAYVNDMIRNANIKAGVVNIENFGKSAGLGEATPTKRIL